MTDSEPDAPSKSPAEAAVEHALDTLVYAPIGLLFEGGSLLPQLVEKGRNQVTMARMIGKFALEQGRVEATKAATKLQDQAAGVLDFIGGSVAPPPAARGQRTPPPASTGHANGTPRAPKAPGAARQAARAVAGVTQAARVGEAPSPAETAGPVETVAVAETKGPPPLPGPSVGDLAIPDYDGLSASHVVNRLAGLSSSELEAVRAYEAANRGRKTILSKVAQLQTA